MSWCAAPSHNKALVAGSAVRDICALSTIALSSVAAIDRQPCYRLPLLLYRNEVGAARHDHYFHGYSSFLVERTTRVSRMIFLTFERNHTHLYSLESTRSI